MAKLPKGITPAEMDRFAQLDRGVKALQAELKMLSDHIKQAYKDEGLTGKRTLTYPSEKFGTIIVTLGEQRRISKEAEEDLQEAFPITKTPEYWKAALDIKAIPALLVDPYREVTMTIFVSVEKEDPEVSPKHVAQS